MEKLLVRGAKWESLNTLRGQSAVDQKKRGKEKKENPPKKLLKTMKEKECTFEWKINYIR